MNREYHKWHSERLNREMELLVFGHAGARVVIFPTSMGRFFDWENRGMIQALEHHINNGWVQLYCVDSVDNESWYNYSAHPHDRARRHLTYHSYITEEVLPFSRSKNSNPFVIAAGASFGAYHAINIALRFPQCFNRSLGMSGIYDVSKWINGYYDETVHEGNPIEYLRNPPFGEHHMDKIKDLDIIFTAGPEDPAYPSNQAFSDVLWNRGVWHAFRTWDGFAHDWPVWHEMILHYIGGPDSR